MYIPLKKAFRDLFKTLKNALRIKSLHCIFLGKLLNETRINALHNGNGISN